MGTTCKWLLLPTLVCMYKLITMHVRLLSTAVFLICYHVHTLQVSTLCYHSFACRYKIFTMYVPGKYTYCKIKCYPILLFKTLIQLLGVDRHTFSWTSIYEKQLCTSGENLSLNIRASVSKYPPVSSLSELETYRITVWEISVVTALLMIREQWSVGVSWSSSHLTSSLASSFSVTLWSKLLIQLRWSSQASLGTSERGWNEKFRNETLSKLISKWMRRT